jgi:Tol biopolymer transport system component
VIFILVVLCWAPATCTQLSRKRKRKGPEAVSFQQLTYQSGPEFFPSLSPDGKSMVYASRASGNWDIYFSASAMRTSLT